MRILCRYALRLTLRPWEMEESDVSVLRAEGFSDRDIVDANQVVSYYNYVNRVADGLGVELEDRWPATVRGRRGYRLRERSLAGDNPSDHHGGTAPGVVTSTGYPGWNRQDPRSLDQPLFDWPTSIR
jgi:hypothetical protein